MESPERSEVEALNLNMLHRILHITLKLNICVKYEPGYFLP